LISLYNAFLKPVICDNTSQLVCKLMEEEEDE